MELFCENSYKFLAVRLSSNVLYISRDIQVLNTPLSTIINFCSHISKVKLMTFIFIFFSMINFSHQHLPETYLEPSRTYTVELFLRIQLTVLSRYTVRKNKFSLKDFFVECDQTHRKFTFTEEILNGNFIFCAALTIFAKHFIVDVRQSSKHVTSCHP